jgi:hypothetical protein
MAVCLTGVWLVDFFVTDCLTECLTAGSDCLTGSCLTGWTFRLSQDVAGGLESGLLERTLVDYAAHCWAWLA